MPFSKTILRQTLKVYCHNFKYLSKTLEINHRIGLDGKEAETITKEHQDYTKKKLRHLNKKQFQDGIKEGIKEGEAKGKEEGLKEGKEEGKMEMAHSLLKEGSDVSLISKVTGLSEEKIKALKSSTSLHVVDKA